MFYKAMTVECDTCSKWFCDICAPPNSYSKLKEFSCTICKLLPAQYRVRREAKIINCPNDHCTYYTGKYYTGVL